MIYTIHPCFGFDETTNVKTYRVTNSFGITFFYGLYYECFNYCAYLNNQIISITST